MKEIFVPIKENRIAFDLEISSANGDYASIFICFQSIDYFEKMWYN